MKNIMIGFLLLMLSIGFYCGRLGWPQYNHYHNSDLITDSSSNVNQKRNFSLFFCGMHKDDCEVIFLFSQTPAQDCFHLVSQWLLRAWQKRIISSPITCQSVIVDSLGSTIFVSFDFSLFDQGMPIHSKIYLINSLLKTIAQISSSFQSVYLFVRHEPMLDEHIDWIKPLEVAGYPVTSF